jgi:hypothetical protein
MLAALLLAVPGLAAPTPEESCEIAKNKAAGAYAACRQAAEAKAVQKGVAPDYTKCDARFQGAFAKAEEKAAKKEAACVDGLTDSDLQSFVADHSLAVAAALRGDGLPTTLCGNGVIDDGEGCDTADLGGATCASELPLVPFAGGGLSCTSECKLDVSACGLHPQCTQPYGVLDDADRHVSFNDGDGNVELCDIGDSGDFTGPGWYRFDGPGGSRLPEAAPAEHACGTDAPGWLNGAHPTPEEGPQVRQVCFNWSGDTCTWNADVQVVNCGGYYLYELPDAPACMLRYCGEY